MLQRALPVWEEVRCDLGSSSSDGLLFLGPQRPQTCVLTASILPEPLATNSSLCKLFPLRALLFMGQPSKHCMCVNVHTERKPESNPIAHVFLCEEASASCSCQRWEMGAGARATRTRAGPRGAVNSEGCRVGIHTVPGLPATSSWPAHFPGCLTSIVPKHSGSGPWRLQPSSGDLTLPRG